MHLTLHTDYALRMLMFLALEPGSPRTIEDIATRYGISRNHLMKVAQTLVQAGFVESLGGRGGGEDVERERGEGNGEDLLHGVTPWGT